MKTIPLTQGMVALVDDDDFERVSKYKWCADRHSKGNQTRWYAQRRLRVSEGRKGTQRLHNFILPGVAEIDHHDHDGLNNQKNNLRSVSRSQNNYNQRLRKNASGFKGVYWHNQSGKWKSQIGHNGRSLSLGLHATKREAALAYDSAAVRLNGEFATTNKLLGLL